MCNSKLKKQRLSKNLTQLQLANKLKIHVSHYQRLEYGTRKPILTLALNLAEILNTTVEELFDTTNKNKNQDNNTTKSAKKLHKGG